MTTDPQIQIGVLLGIAALLGVITLALGAAMEWLLGPVQPEADDELPTFVRPIHPVLTAPCARCGEMRLADELVSLNGQLVCTDWCGGRAA
jgi:hypothetical protein